MTKPPILSGWRTFHESWQRQGQPDMNNRAKNARIVSDASAEASMPKVWHFCRRMGTASRRTRVGECAPPSSVANALQVLTYLR